MEKMVFTRKDGDFHGLCLLVSGAGYLDVSRAYNLSEFDFLEAIFVTFKVSHVHNHSHYGSMGRLWSNLPT